MDERKTCSLTMTPLNRGKFKCPKLNDLINKETSQILKAAKELSKDFCEVSSLENLDTFKQQLSKAARNTMY